MTKAVQRRRGTNAEHSSFTGLEGEISIDTTLDTLVLHDGSTAGGFPMAAPHLDNAFAASQSFGTLDIFSGSITDSSGAISFGDENLTTTGTLAAGATTVSSLSTSSTVAPSDTVLSSLLISSTTPSSVTANLQMGVSGDLAVWVFDNGGAGWTRRAQFTNTGMAVNGTLAAGAGSGFGLARTDGTLHVHTASAGAVTANVGADELVVENSAAGGISILTPDASKSTLALGSPTANMGLLLDWTYSTGVATLTPLKVGAALNFGADNGVLNLTLSGASGSELATFAGDVTLAGGKLGSTAAAYGAASVNGTWSMGGDAAGGLNFNALGSALAYEFRSNDTSIFYISNAGNGVFAGTLTAAAATVQSASPVIQLTATTTTATTLGAKNNRLLLTSNSTTLGGGGEIVFNTSDSNTGRWGAISGHIKENASGAASGAIVFATKATTADTALTERMRIDNSGVMLVGTTTIDRTADAGLHIDPVGFLDVSRTSNLAVRLTRLVDTGTIVLFRQAATTVGTISVTGSATAYNTSSDYRLKEDAVPMTGATERVKALRPINFAWKADGSRVDGFLAHEAQEVVPECVTGSKDAMQDEEYEVTPAVYEDVITPAVEAVAAIEAIEAVEAVDAVYDDEGILVSEAIEAVEAVVGVDAVEAQEATTESVLVTEAVMGTRSVPDYQGIDQSKLVPLLVAALQEAIARIEILEG